MRTRADKGLNGTAVLDSKTTVPLENAIVGKRPCLVGSGNFRLLKRKKLAKKMRLKMYGKGKYSLRSGLPGQNRPIGLRGRRIEWRRPAVNAGTQGARARKLRNPYNGAGSRTTNRWRTTTIKPERPNRASSRARPKKSQSVRCTTGNWCAASRAIFARTGCRRRFRLLPFRSSLSAT